MHQLGLVCFSNREQQVTWSIQGFRQQGLRVRLVSSLSRDERRVKERETCEPGVLVPTSHPHPS